MEAFVSLWSADLLALGEDVRRIEDLAAGFHIDVFDGHNVPELLFGPDLVASLRAFTAARIEVHLNVTDPGYWVERFAAAGADIITIQSGPCADVAAVLSRIRALGCVAGLGIELHEPAASAAPFFGLAGRLLLLGTPIGVRGRSLDPATPARVAELVQARERSPHHPDIVIDGGVRRHTVPLLAAAGADGVVPGSLVYGADDPRAVLTEIAALAPGRPPCPASGPSRPGHEGRRRPGPAIWPSRSWPEDPGAAPRRGVVKAIVYDAPRRWRYADLPDPLPGAGEVLLRVTAAGVCGTDVHLGSVPRCGRWASLSRADSPIS